MGQFELRQQALEGDGLLDGVEIFTLDVLDECDGDGRLVGDILDQAGHHFETGQLGGAPAAFTSNDFETVFTDGANHDGLDHPLCTDGVGQLLQRVLGHIFARLVFAGLQPLHRQLAQFPLIGRGHGLFGALVAHHLFLAGGRAGAEQGVQPLAQPTFLRRHMLSRSAVSGWDSCSWRRRISPARAR